MSARPALMGLLAVLVAIPALGGQPAAKETALDAATKRLASTKVTIDADKQHPDKVLDQIRDEAGVNIVIEPEVRRRWETETISLKLKDASALSAFYHIVRNLDLVALWANDAYIVTTPQKAQPHPQITIYDIRDLTEVARGTRLPPQLFGGQIDPLYYWYRGQLGGVSGTPYDRDPFGELELLDRYPPNAIGEAIAMTAQQLVGGKDLGVSVTYYEGYLVVVQQPKAARLPLTPAEIRKAMGGTSAQ